MNTIVCRKKSIILAYDFEKVAELNCHPEDKGQTLENTKETCKNNHHCVGVFQKKCTSEEDSYVCLKNATISSHAQTEGCFYKKFAIGM